jgi:hypothetical protein
VSAAVQLQQTVVEPVLDGAAAERARLINAARARLLRSGGAVDVEQIARATGKKHAAVRQWISRERKNRRLVSVTQGKAVLVPTFQLTDTFDIDEEVASVIARLIDHGMSGWAVWDWFATPNAWLDGASPQDVARGGDLAAVHGAVDGLFQE